MTTPDHTETRILPAWLYPAFFWGALPVLGASLLFPPLTDLGIIADQLADKGVDRLAHGLDEIRQFRRVHLDIGNPRHQVFAKADLRVRGAGGRDCAPVLKIAQMRGNGG